MAVPPLSRREAIIADWDLRGTPRVRQRQRTTDLINFAFVGDFFVRSVERKPGCLAIIVKISKGRVKNFLIKHTPDWSGYQIQGNTRKFSTLQDLLLYFSTQQAPPISVRLTDFRVTQVFERRRSATSLSHAFRTDSGHTIAIEDSGGNNVVQQHGVPRSGFPQDSAMSAQHMQHGGSTKSLQRILSPTHGLHENQDYHPNNTRSGLPIAKPGDSISTVIAAEHHEKRAEKGAIPQSLDFEALQKLLSDPDAIKQSAMLQHELEVMKEKKEQLKLQLELYRRRSGLGNSGDATSAMKLLTDNEAIEKSQQMQREISELMRKRDQLDRQLADLAQQRKEIPRKKRNKKQIESIDKDYRDLENERFQVEQDRKFLEEERTQLVISSLEAELGLQRDAVERHRRILEEERVKHLEERDKLLATLEEERIKHKEEIMRLESLPEWAQSQKKTPTQQRQISSGISAHNKTDHSSNEEEDREGAVPDWLVELKMRKTGLAGVVTGSTGNAAGVTNQSAKDASKENNEECIHSKVEAGGDATSVESFDFDFDAVPGTKEWEKQLAARKALLEKRSEERRKLIAEREKKLRDAELQRLLLLEREQHERKFEERMEILKQEEKARLTKERERRKKEESERKHLEEQRVKKEKELREQQAQQHEMDLTERKQREAELMEELEKAKRREEQFRIEMEEHEVKRSLEERKWREQVQAEKRFMEDRIRKEQEQRRQVQQTTLQELKRQKEVLIRQQRAFEEAMSKIQRDVAQSKSAALQAIQSVEWQHHVLELQHQQETEGVNNLEPPSFTTDTDALSSFSSASALNEAMSSSKTTPAYPNSSRDTPKSQLSEKGSNCASVDVFTSSAADQEPFKIDADTYLSDTETIHGSENDNSSDIHESQRQLLQLQSEMQHVKDSQTHKKEKDVLHIPQHSEFTSKPPLLTAGRLKTPILSQQPKMPQAQDEPLRLVKFKKPVQLSLQTSEGGSTHRQEQCTFLGNCQCPNCRDN